MNSNTLLRGKLIDSPVGIDGFETELVLFKLTPHSGPFLYDVSILCKGSLARILVSYFRTGTMLEVSASLSEIEDCKLPADITKPVLTANTIKFLYIQKAEENVEIGKMVS